MTEEKKEKEVRRFWHGDEVPMEVVHACDYDAACKRIRELEEENASLRKRVKEEAEITRQLAKEFEDIDRETDLELSERANQLQALQQQTERLVEAAGRALDKMSLATPEDCELWNVLREALKPFQK